MVKWLLWRISLLQADAHCLRSALTEAQHGYKQAAQEQWVRDFRAQMAARGPGLVHHGETIIWND